MPGNCCFSDGEGDLICLFRGLLRLLYAVMDGCCCRDNGWSRKTEDVFGFEAW